jgi:hypothetical protein
MTSNTHLEWFPSETIQFSSLESTLASDPSETSNPYSLPPIEEEQWDFDWKDPFENSHPYACFEQNLHDAGAEPERKDEVRPMNEELNDMQQKVQQMRKDILELQDISFERLDRIEEVVKILRSYVNNMVPWSMEVHKKCSKLLEVVERQETVAVGGGQASTKYTTS